MRTNSQKTNKRKGSYIEQRLNKIPLEKLSKESQAVDKSEMKSRWVAVALLEVENKMRRINNYNKLHLLRAAIKSELNIKQQKVAYLKHGVLLLMKSRLSLTLYPAHIRYIFLLI